MQEIQKKQKIDDFQYKSIIFVTQKNDKLFMTKVISRESISRANNRIIQKKSRLVSMDESNVSMKCKTSFGTKNIVISRDRITTAASSALKKVLG
nr:MAG TPA: hypothetical protein [Caudoviricetes sp.]